jgi:hypothetical protein
MGSDAVRVVLHLTDDDYQRVRQHLFGDDSCDEAAGFLFVGHRSEGQEHSFEQLDWYPVSPDGYAVRNAFHFELTDEVRAHVIKRAHDLGASIVEVHSHGGPWSAAFSPSDQLGFREFVPHVWWRLKGRPYLALVATRQDFDGLAWITGPEDPQRLDGIMVDGQMLRPTRLSSLTQDRHEY